jgi:DNA-binding CsgD family transcriptional regulator
MLAETYDALLSAPSDADLFPFLHQHAEALGFAAVQYGVFAGASDATITDRVIHTTLPAPYQDAYSAAGFSQDDPRVRRAAVQLTPFTWYDCPEFDQARHTRRGRKSIASQMLDLAAAHGFVDGVVVPSHSVSGQGVRHTGMIGLYRTSLGCPDLPCWFRFLCQLLHEQISMVDVPCGSRFDDTGSYGARPKGGWILSDRERHCLHWAARGKRRCEIAHILGVSAATVDSYLRAALERLDAVSTTQAVATAIREGLIVP